MTLVQSRFYENLNLVNLIKGTLRDLTFECYRNYYEGFRFMCTLTVWLDCRETRERWVQSVVRVRLACRSVNMLSRWRTTFTFCYLLS